ncbi:MAG: DUF2157 domain-containing protein [Alphaproteobacteria bacterium]
MANLQKQLDELLKHHIIDLEAKEKIAQYYEGKDEEPHSFLQLAIVLIGVTLIGLGVILLIAYNWAQLNQTTKLALSFMPIILSYGTLIFILLKYPQKEGLLQGFLLLSFLSTGACMSLIGQIYQVQSSLEIFLRNWLLLTLPLIFILPRFIIVSIFGILASILAQQSLYEWNSAEMSMVQKAVQVLFFCIPFGYYFFRLYQNNTDSNSRYEVMALQWLLPVFSLPYWIVFASYLEKYEFAAFLFMVILPTLWLLIGYLSFIWQKDYRGTNGFILLSGLAMLTLIYLMSFSLFKEIADEFEPFVLNNILWLILLFINIISVVISYKKTPIHLGGIQMASLMVLIAVFLVMFEAYWLCSILANIMLIYLGVYYLYLGSKLNLMWQSNVGLAILCILIITRFFESDMSLVVKGVSFIVIGIFFLISNIIMLRKKREHKKEQAHA